MDEKFWLGKEVCRIEEMKVEPQPNSWDFLFLGSFKKMGTFQKEDEISGLFSGA